MTWLLGVDVGSTHCKAGLFGLDGTVRAVTSAPTQTHRATEGYIYLDPEEVWRTVGATIREALNNAEAREVAAIGIASMAETGLLLDAKTGQPRSFFVPWFDTSAEPQAELIRQQGDALERFCRTGIRASFKCGLAKILWLRGRDTEITNGARWLSAADYIAYRLTGEMATDASLAGRTFAFRIDDRQWDEEWIARFGLRPDLFPEARASGTVIGRVQDDAWALRGTPVAIAGHDHVCAEFAAGTGQADAAFDSMGTAEALVGTVRAREIGEREFRSGLAFGCAPVQEQFYWMGGVSASGGSVEWLRAVLNEPPLSYQEIESLAGQRQAPTGILYFPYLLGSQARMPNANVKAGFVGLNKTHGRAELVRAVLEGTAYELETIRRAAESVTGQRIERIYAAGGGTKNRAWLQIKADVSGCAIRVAPIQEATVLGAAMLAGIGSGRYADPNDARGAFGKNAAETIMPDMARHADYQRLYERAYLPIHDALEQISKELM